MVNYEFLCCIFVTLHTYIEIILTCCVKKIECSLTCGDYHLVGDIPRPSSSSSGPDPGHITDHCHNCLMRLNAAGCWHDLKSQIILETWWYSVAVLGRICEPFLIWSYQSMALLRILLLCLTVITTALKNNLTWTTSRFTVRDTALSTTMDDELRTLENQRSGATEGM